MPNLPLHFIGLGGTGCNALEYLHSKGIQAKKTCITHPERSHLPEDIGFIHFLPPGQTRDDDPKSFSGVSDMSIPLLLPEEVKAVFKSNDRYILLAGLGGYTGTYMVDRLIPWLRDQGKEVAVICSLPFGFEGEKRRFYANNVLEKYRALPGFKSFDLKSLYIRTKYGKKPIQAILEEFHLLLKEFIPNS